MGSVLPEKEQLKGACMCEGMSRPPWHTCTLGSDAAEVPQHGLELPPGPAIRGRSGSNCRCRHAGQRQAALCYVPKDRGQARHLRERPRGQQQLQHRSVRNRQVSVRPDSVR